MQRPWEDRNWPYLPALALFPISAITARIVLGADPKGAWHVPVFLGATAALTGLAITATLSGVVSAWRAPGWCIHGLRIAITLVLAGAGLQAFFSLPAFSDFPRWLGLPWLAGSIVVSATLCLGAARHRALSLSGGWVPRRLSASAVAKEPHLVWNEFIDLLAMGEYDEMNPVQRRAHVVFWYDAEVQNGGHHQYFVNSAGQRRREAVEALVALELECQASVLRTAIQLWESRGREPPRSAQEFVDAALEGEFEQCDSAYHECSPTITDALERLLRDHQEEFVIIEDGSQVARHR